MKNNCVSILEVIIFLIILLRFLPLIWGQQLLTPAIYVFGDSTVDSGNNNYLPTVARANYAPYGRNFPGGKAPDFLPTGRFNDGRTVADYIAEFLGLPYPPPYIGEAYFQTVPEGINFASATCGILKSTGQRYGKCLSMEEQVEAFGWAVEKLKIHFKDKPEALSNHLGKAVVVISIGNNDYFQGPMDQLQNQEAVVPDPQQFAQSLIDTFSGYLKRLYDLGLRKVVVFEVGPLGCVPSVVRTYPKQGNGLYCYEEANRVVRIYNSMLAELLKHLTANLRGSFFVLAREFDVGYFSIHHPAELGYIDTVNPCCTAWMNGTLSLCIPWLDPCPNPDKFFFWDAVHYSDAVAKRLAASCFEDTNTCNPRIKDLVRL